MKKRRLLFVMPSFNIGGVTVLMSGVIALLDRKKYDITVCALSNEGTNRSRFADCHIIKAPLSLRRLESERGLAKIFVFLIKCIINGLALLGFDKNALIAKTITMRRYDTAIACQEGDLTKIVPFLKADKHIAWMNCNYDSYVELGGDSNELPFYSMFTSIVCVSEYTKSGFLRHYPSLISKTHAIHPPQNTDKIISLSRCEIDNETFTNPNGFKIISIGRLDPIKRFAFIPQIAAEIKKNGIKFCWYIIGSGHNQEQLQLLQDNIAKYSVQDCVFFLGAQVNPYNYLSNSDLLVSTSISEAAPMVVREAQILHVPVLSTDYPSALELIDSTTGIISSFEELPDKLTALLTNRANYDGLKKSVSKFTFSNDKIIDQIEGIL